MGWGVPEKAEAGLLTLEQVLARNGRAEGKESQFLGSCWLAA